MKEFNQKIVLERSWRGGAQDGTGFGQAVFQMGTHGTGRDFHQHSACGHLYKSTGLLRAFDVDREDSFAADYGRGDRIFAQSAGQFCGLPPGADFGKKAENADGEEPQPCCWDCDGADCGGHSGVRLFRDAAAAAL